MIWLICPLENSSFGERIRKNVYFFWGPLSNLSILYYIIYYINLYYILSSVLYETYVLKYRPTLYTNLCVGNTLVNCCRRSGEVDSEEFVAFLFSNKGSRASLSKADWDDNSKKSWGRCVSWAGCTIRSNIMYINILCI